MKKAVNKFKANMSAAGYVVQKTLDPLAIYKKDRSIAKQTEERATLSLRIRLEPRGSAARKKLSEAGKKMPKIKW